MTPYCQDVIEEEAGWDGTLSRLRQLSRIAATRIRTHTTPDEELIDLAMSELCLLVAETPDMSTRQLIARAVDGVQAEIRGVRHSYGVATDYERESGRFTGARHHAYWGRRTHYDDYCLEEMAARQVWDALTPRHRDALLARMSGEPMSTSAYRLGIARTGLVRRIREARMAASSLWHDWESPPLPQKDLRRTSTHCPAGHPYAEYGRTTRAGGRRSTHCRECDRIAARERRAREVIA